MQSVKKGVHRFTPTEDPFWNWGFCDYAIIDDTQPVIDWDEFDWDFFNPFGGVPVVDDIGIKWHKQTAGKTDRCELCPSTFYYYWPGGKCPVPGNVEVEIINYVKDHEVNRADLIEWRDTDNEEDVVAFRLTGKVYPPKHKEEE